MARGLFGITGSSNATAVENGSAPVYVWCTHCGTLGDTFFVKGEFVIVTAKGKRPAYARIVHIEMTSEGPMVTLDLSGEKILEHIDFISKVG